MGVGSAFIPTLKGGVFPLRPLRSPEIKKRKKKRKVRSGVTGS